MAVDPLVAQALGAGDRAAARRAVQRGLVIAAGVFWIIERSSALLG